MSRTRLKFCGITRVEDALAAANIGADAVGMVFHPPSSRCITQEVATAIMNILPPMVTPVALFVDAPVDEVADFSARLGVSTVQLHGHESPQDVARLSHLRPTLKILKAIRVEPHRLTATLATWRAARQELNLTNFAGILLETNTVQAGGTGEENDWATIDSAQREGAFAGLPPIIAAGGLTPQNVQSVITRLRPWAVDVSSGIEETRGIKSVEKMQAFAAAVAAADRA